LSNSAKKGFYVACRIALLTAWTTRGSKGSGIMQSSRGSVTSAVRLGDTWSVKLRIVDRFAWT